METATAGVSPSLTVAARSSCRRDSKGFGKGKEISLFLLIVHTDENYFGHARLEKVP